jgi:hypothetical protein
MTSLKCWNSGVESNGAAFILSPVECGYVSRDSGAYGKEVSSSSLLSLAREFFVRHAPSYDLFHNGGEAFRVRGLAVVVPERLFVQVAEQVEGLHADVGAVQPALQEAPEVFHRVRVNVAVDVLNCVVDDFMAIVRFQSIVGEQFIAENRGTCFYAFADQALQFALAASLYVVNNDFTATFDHAENDLFTIRPASLDFLRSLGLVHIAGLCADERFIDFDFASEHVKTPVLHGKADAVQHKPSCLLGDSKTAMDFVRTNNVFCPNDEPCGGKPLLKADRRVFEDGSSLKRKRRARVFRVALPDTLFGEISNLLCSAARTLYNAIRPAQRDHKIAAVFEVREPDYRVPESVWRFHVSSMPENPWNVKYVITIVKASAIAAAIAEIGEPLLLVSSAS